MRKLALLVFAVSGAAVAVASAAVAGYDPFGTAAVGDNVGGRILLPSNQYISPLGTRALVSNARLLSSTLNPDGTKLAALSWNNFNGFLTIMDVKTGKVLQQVGTGTSTDPSLGDSTVAADGPLYSADGKTLWFPQSADLLKFSVNPDGTVAPSPTLIKLSGPNGDALPSGMALSADGSRLYVALNGNNTLGVIDTTTNQLTKEIPVGNAPRQVVINGNQAYVSNEGGRSAVNGDFTNLSDNTPIVADRSTGGAITGTVSVVDLAKQAVSSSIPVGLQPTALKLARDALFVANSNGDSLSIIDTKTNQVAQTDHINPVPGARVGSYPNAIDFVGTDKLLVSIGRDNAIAEYAFHGLTEPLQFKALLPTDWYPVNVQADPTLGPGAVVVTNDKGIGARGPLATIDKGPLTKPATGNNTYDDTGSVTTFTMPSGAQLAGFTEQVFANNGWNQIRAINSGTGDTVPSIIPPRIGGQSRIKHVFVLVKENRTYDQVLGDQAGTNGNPALTQFGQTVTPNAHALATRFGAFDNFYDVGTLSADGHNWIVQANANDYVEKQFGAFYRSYPAQGGDALAYQRNGFIWNAAQRAGRSVAAFGEYANFFNVPSTGAPTWNDWYKDSQILEGKANGPLPVPINKYKTYSDIPSLNAILDPAYPKFDLNVPDQYRVDIWERAFKRSLQTGNLPNLNLMWLPVDHTSGVGAGDPYPVAQVADNDLAVGRIVNDITHSKFWKSTAIFVVEDDPQNGVDHVDGHRSLLWVISPYSRPQAVNSDYYSQINVVRTTEQILGIRPMNQLDRAAVPMYSAFQNDPNYTPYTVKPNQIPLTLGAPGATTASVHSALARRYTRIPAAEVGVYRQWAAWSRHQRFNGRLAVEDWANPAQLNRLDWYSATGWRRVYPGDLKILAPNQVPGRHRSSLDIGTGG